MPLTIPLLVPEQVIDWAVKKGYLEFEYEGVDARAGREPQELEVNTASSDVDAAPCSAPGGPPPPCGSAQQDVLPQRLEMERRTLGTIVCRFI